MTRRPRKWARTLAMAALAGVLGYGGLRAWAAWNYRAALVEVHQQMDAGRHGVAARNLAALLDRESGSDEARYLLGVCESARGRPEAADAAWSRVAPGSPFAAPAIRSRAGLLVDRGRFAEAERRINQALDDPRIDGFELRRFLSNLYWHEGRLEESLRLIEANWEALNQTGQAGSDRAIEQIRLHIAAVLGTSSVESVGRFLERAERLAPEDDRIWLGKANLANRQGRFDEAGRRLDACFRRNPDDPPAWRSRLAWALATGRVAEARTALLHIPAAEATPAEVFRLAAWFAARRPDPAAERRALERVIAVDPGDGAALDRLAELAIQAGQSDRAAELRARKAALDPIKSRFKDRFLRHQTVRDAEPMAQMAEQLGRTFEARALWSLARATEPDRAEPRAALARIERQRAELIRAESGRTHTLAERLAAEDQDGAIATHRPDPDPAPAPAPVAVRLDATAPIRFRDDAAPAGLRFLFDNGVSEQHQMPEYMSGGVGLIDFDGDGSLDVYVVQGGPFPPRPDGSGRGPGDRLFRNRGDGTFADVTYASGLSKVRQGYGHGAAVGDYDNDGHADLFVTRWRSYALYRNRGDGTFADVTESAGLAGDRDWPTSAAFADLDNDGDLDLYVCHYLRWDEAHPELCRNVERSIPVSCDPRHFEALPDHLFRNDRGHFIEVTTAAVKIDREGRGLGVVAVDVDDDNRIDLFVANDLSDNYLLRNKGHFRFDEVGLTSGVACNASGGNQAGMGVAAGDLDGDGRPELTVTNYFNESTSLFHNLGDGQFADYTAVVGLAVPSRDRLGFGVAFLDANNDGRLDLLTANGHLNDYRPEVPYAMPVQLLLGGPDGRLTDVTARGGPAADATSAAASTSALMVPHIGRGLAVGDLDNDGRMDAILVSQGEPLVYLHNQTAGGHWLSIALEGTASNRDGVGARVIVEAGGLRQVSQRYGGGSYQSANDPRVHFGLGAATRVDRLEVRWPSGRLDRLSNLDADRIYRLREGDPSPVGAGHQEANHHK